MKKPLFFLMIIIMVVASFAVYRFFNGDPKKLAETEDAVYEYLIVQRGYEEDDIHSIRPEYSWKDERRNAYMAFVTFKSDPENEHMYIYNKEEGIRER